MRKQERIARDWCNGRPSEPCSKPATCGKVTVTAADGSAVHMTAKRVLEHKQHLKLDEWCPLCQVVPRPRPMEPAAIIPVEWRPGMGPTNEPDWRGERAANK